jgi:hypothetical protein
MTADPTAGPARPGYGAAVSCSRSGTALTLGFQRNIPTQQAPGRSPWPATPLQCSEPPSLTLPSCRTHLAYYSDGLIMTQLRQALTHPEWARRRRLGTTAPGLYQPRRVCRCRRVSGDNESVDSPMTGARIAWRLLRRNMDAINLAHLQVLPTETQANSQRLPHSAWHLRTTALRPRAVFLHQRQPPATAAGRAHPSSQSMPRHDQR